MFRGPEWLDQPYTGADRPALSLRDWQERVMLNLNDAYYFVQVVDQGSFASAARTMQLPKSTLSHRVGELEAALGVRLLSRNSRQVAVTHAGAEFYRRARDVLRIAADAEDAIRSSLSEPSGLVRVTTTCELSEFVLCDLLSLFLKRHPKVRIVEEATDRLVDIVAEGFDLAVRGHNGPLKDSTLISRHLASAPWLLFAGRSYIEEAGVPKTPDDLARHATLSLSRSGLANWHLHDSDGRTYSLTPTPRFQTNNMVSLKSAACGNLGVAALPAYICRRELAAGSLVQVLPGWTAMAASFSAVLPYRVGVPPAVRALLDFLAGELPGALATKPQAERRDALGAL